MTNKRISPFTLGSLAGFNLLLYGFFISKYIQNETISVVIVTSLYLLIFTLFVLTDLFIKNMTKQKTKLLLSLMVFCIQFGLGVFLTTVWFRPRSAYVLSQPMWLTHLRILTQLHYFIGISILFKNNFKIFQK